MTLPMWSKRSPEEAYLFNPAFCAALIYENTKSYIGTVHTCAPIPLVLVSLVLVLHRKSRESLPKSIVRSYFRWLHENEHLRVDFPQRVRNFRPRFQEALMFALTHQVLSIKESARLQLGVNKANFTSNAYKQCTKEMQDIIQKVRFLGRWHARSGSVSSILSSWGVRP